MENTKITHKYLFIAVKPEYANKLISGRKDIELRKMKPKIHSGDYIIIYASAPVKAVVGFGKVNAIILCSPQEMWNKHSERLGIDKQGFYSYYNGYNKAVGIEFEMIKPVAPIGLLELRTVDPNFHPPQLYRYVTNDDIIRVLANHI